MKALPLTRKTLDSLSQGGCGVEGCGHDHNALFFVSRCCVSDPAVRYDPASGLLHLDCSRCSKPIVAFQAT